MALRYECAIFCYHPVDGFIGRKVFYTYYQINRDYQPDGAKSEPKKGKKELKDYGPHSLFGIVWHIATETGWSHHYIMWQLPFDTIMRMMHDAPVRMKL